MNGDDLADVLRRIKWGVTERGWTADDVRLEVDAALKRYYTAGPTGIIPAEPARHAHTARRPSSEGLQPDAPRKADA